MQLLTAYDYPGNVRELENFIEAAVVLCENGAVTPTDLPVAVQKAVEQPAEGGVVVTAGMPLEEVERLCIIEALRHTEGNKRRAAALLGISREVRLQQAGPLQDRRRLPCRRGRNCARRRRRAPGGQRIGPLCLRPAACG